jgi:hypothetical protein
VRVWFCIIRARAEIVIEDGTPPATALSTPVPPRRSIEECIALLPVHSPATIDEDFAGDVAAVVIE